MEKTETTNCLNHSISNNRTFLKSNFSMTSVDSGGRLSLTLSNTNICKNILQTYTNRYIWTRKLPKKKLVSCWSHLFLLSEVSGWVDKDSLLLINNQDLKCLCKRANSLNNSIAHNNTHLKTADFSMSVATGDTLSDNLTNTQICKNVLKI